MPPIYTTPIQTGIRWLDDLRGAAPGLAAPTPPAQPHTLKAATPYETYVQPAILGLKNAIGKVTGKPGEDPTGGMFGPDMGMAAHAAGGLVGALGQFIHLPKGLMLRHGGTAAIEQVAPEYLSEHATFGKALYTAPDVAGEISPTVQHFANQRPKNVTSLKVARDLPVWDADVIGADDIDRFSGPMGLGDQAVAELHQNPSDLRTLVAEHLRKDPSLLDQVGVGGVKYDYAGGPAVALSTGALDRGFVTGEQGQLMTAAARARAIEGIKRAGERGR